MSFLLAIYHPTDLGFASMAKAIGALPRQSL